MPAIAAIRTEHMPANTAHNFIRGHGAFLQGCGFSGAVGAGHAGDCDNSDGTYANKHGARPHSRAWPTPTGARLFVGLSHYGALRQKASGQRGLLGAVFRCPPRGREPRPRSARNLASAAARACSRLCQCGFSLSPLSRGGNPVC